MATEVPSADRIAGMLEDNGIRPTPARIMTFKALAGASRPLSTQEIETELDTLDRSSITRTLALFASHRIIHEIDDGSGSKRFEICRELGAGVHSDEHPHFHCRICGDTFCLTGHPLQAPQLPEGFKPESTQMIISGVCPKCNAGK